VLGVERVREAEKGRQLVDHEPILPVERYVGQVALLRCTASMVAGNVRDDRGLLVRETEDLRGGEQIL
jgi:hypothetical protein